jgi:hypothetical protein
LPCSLVSRGDAFDVCPVVGDVEVVDASCDRRVDEMVGLALEGTGRVDHEIVWREIFRCH